MELAASVFRWTLLAAVVLLAVIGLLHLTRGTAVRHVRGVGADGTSMSPVEPEFPLGVAMLTGAVLLDGNRVEIALNGDGTFGRLWEDLRSAQRSIVVQNYYDAFGTANIPARHLAALRAVGLTVVPFRT